MYLIPLNFCRPIFAQMQKELEFALGFKWVAKMLIFTSLNIFSNRLLKSESNTFFNSLCKIVN